MSEVTSGRGSESSLDSLHGLVALTLTEQIKQYTDGKMFSIDKEGNKCPLPIPAALLAQALKFLSDNGIDSPAALPRLDTLKRALPKFDPEADTSVVQFRPKAV
jgi:hypothetical protein